MDAASGVSAAIQGAVAQATGVINDNMPLVFGVAILFVGWAIGRRVLGKI